MDFRANRFVQFVCAAMVLMLVLSSVHPDSVFDWFLENATAGAFLLVLILTYRRFAFSDLSYVLILVYLSIHEWGAHYKYSDVPLGEWLKPLLHTHRNMYDRVAHFSFGLLLSYPMQEVCMRAVRVSSKWRYFLPIEATLSFSAIYEMLEALAASVLTPQRGEEFVGMQGDMWDSQEDMFMAGLGAVVAMLAMYLIRRRMAARAVKRELAEAYAGAGK